MKKVIIGMQELLELKKMYPRVYYYSIPKHIEKFLEEELQKEDSGAKKAAYESYYSAIFFDSSIKFWKEFRTLTLDTLPTFIERHYKIFTSNGGKPSVFLDQLSEDIQRQVWSDSFGVMDFTEEERTDELKEYFKQANKAKIDLERKGLLLDWIDKKEKELVDDTSTKEVNVGGKKKPDKTFKTVTATLSEIVYLATLISKSRFKNRLTENTELAKAMSLISGHSENTLEQGLSTSKPNSKAQEKKPIGDASKRTVLQELKRWVTEIEKELKIKG